MNKDAPRAFSKVLEDELVELNQRRNQLFPGQQRLAASPSQPEHEFVEAHQLRPLGLSFSGGGIRSGTFHLGILQGLAEIGLLPYIDYLSTVSGGGYIGAWLHGLIRNKHHGHPYPAQLLLDPHRVPGEPEDDPITFLRKYSNYLAPSLGVFSPDFWTIAAVWLRNMLLNQMILIPFLAAVVLTTLLGGIVHLGIRESWSSVGLVAGGVALVIAVGIIGVNLRRVIQYEFSSATVKSSTATREEAQRTGKWQVSIAAAGVLVASYVLGAVHYDRWILLGCGVAVLILFALMQAIGGFGICYRARHQGASGWFYFLFIPAVCGVVTAALLWLVWTYLDAWRTPEGQWARIALGMPFIVAVWLTGVTLQIGLMGSDFPDAAREWLARFGAMLSIGITGWIALFGISIFGPYWLARLTLAYLPAAAAGLAAWIGAGAGAYFAGNSAKTAGGPAQAQPDKSTAALEILARLAPVLFLVGFLLLVSLGTHLAIRGGVEAVNVRTNCFTPVKTITPDWLKWLEPVQTEYWCLLDFGEEPLAAAESRALLLWLACLGLILILPARFNINEFSMHHFYKNRLVRCYLGAGRGKARHPNRLTGFDPLDDFPIAEISPRAQKPYFGPYPIVNCALNLNTGSELAKQERKASSFVFTPGYCGFEPARSLADKRETQARRSKGLHAEGYRPTSKYMQPDKGPNLGTAMGISGAAASPNMGYHTAAPLAFLLTILNVRLGWWLGNPRRDRPSRRPGPANALLSLLSELFAQTNGRSWYVNVTDGGHFENLGLYELVRRRCRYIIVGDSEEDPEFTFGALGGAIRKCRADFGVEIEIDPKPIRRSADGSSSVHCVMGTITYPEEEAGYAAAACGGGQGEPTAGPARGWILYLKSSLTGNEPEDVQQYHAGHPVFPHESTSNQFFTESQFESYRQLGLHVVRTAFENVRTRPSPANQQNMLEMFQDLCRKWYPAPEARIGNYTERYAELMRRLSTDPDLRFMDFQLFPQMLERQPPQDVKLERKRFFYCLELIQLMEDIYFDLDFQSRTNRSNPQYGGWIADFQRWARSPAMQETWAIARSSYNPLFREFFDRLASDESLG